jgi:hypothetical protein
MLPTPEEERAAIWALCTCLGLAIVGAVAVMVIGALALKAVLDLIADWMFP